MIRLEIHRILWKIKQTGLWQVLSVRNQRGRGDIVNNRQIAELLAEFKKIRIDLDSMRASLKTMAEKYAVEEKEENKG